MADRYVIEQVGDQQLLARLAAAIQGLEHPRQLYVDIGGVIEQNVNIRFDSKRAPDGVPWLPISPNTATIWERIHKIPLPGTLLERTRRMRNSFEAHASDQGMKAGFGVPYEIYHETGTRRGLPRRQVLFDDAITGTLGAEDQADIVNEIEVYLSDLLAG